jgi:hypothetical protein
MARHAVRVLRIIRAAQRDRTRNLGRDRDICGRRVVFDPGTRSPFLGVDSDFQ